MPDLSRVRKYAYPDHRSPEQRATDLADAALWGEMARAWRQQAQRIDQVILDQIDATGPVVQPAPILESVRDALRVLDESTRTILVAPADQQRVTAAVQLFPLVKVVASSMIDPGTAYLVNTAVLELAYDPPRLTGPQGGPIPTNAAIRFDDVS